MKENIIQEVKLSYTAKLVEWVQQVLNLPLDRDDEKKIVEAKFDGGVFLEGAGNLDFFMRAGLSFGTSVKLTKGINGTAIQGKFYSLSYHIQSIRPS
jgi:hypothetical protein